ncbi:MAG: hypothetical protein ACKVQC_07390, partial [Elusimicrobiota bacterium]
MMKNKNIKKLSAIFFSLTYLHVNVLWAASPSLPLPQMVRELALTSSNDPLVQQVKQSTWILYAWNGFSQAILNRIYPSKYSLSVPAQEIFVFHQNAQDWWMKQPKQQDGSSVDKTELGIQREKQGDTQKLDEVRPNASAINNPQTREAAKTLLSTPDAVLSNPGVGAKQMSVEGLAGGDVKNVSDALKSNPIINITEDKTGKTTLFVKGKEGTSFKVELTKGSDGKVTAKFTVEPKTAAKQDSATNLTPKAPSDFKGIQNPSVKDIAKQADVYLPKIGFTGDMKNVNPASIKVEGQFKETSKGIVFEGKISFQTKDGTKHSVQVDNNGKVTEALTLPPVSSAPANPNFATPQQINQLKEDAKGKLPEQVNDIAVNKLGEIVQSKVDAKVAGLENVKAPDTFKALLAEAKAVQPGNAKGKMELSAKVEKINVSLANIGLRIEVVNEGPKAQLVVQKIIGTDELKKSYSLTPAHMSAIDDAKTKLGKPVVFVESITPGVQGLMGLTHVMTQTKTSGDVINARFTEVQNVVIYVSEIKGNTDKVKDGGRSGSSEPLTTMLARTKFPVQLDNLSTGDMIVATVAHEVLGHAALSTTAPARFTELKFDLSGEKQNQAKNIDEGFAHFQQVLTGSPLSVMANLHSLYENENTKDVATLGTIGMEHKQGSTMVMGTLYKQYSEKTGDKSPTYQKLSSYLSNLVKDNKVSDFNAFFKEAAQGYSQEHLKVDLASVVPKAQAITPTNLTPVVDNGPAKVLPNADNIQNPKIRDAVNVLMKNPENLFTKPNIKVEGIKPNDKAALEAVKNPQDIQILEDKKTGDVTLSVVGKNGITAQVEISATPRGQVIARFANVEQKTEDKVDMSAKVSGNFKGIKDPSLDGFRKNAKEYLPKIGFSGDITNIDRTSIKVDGKFVQTDKGLQFVGKVEFKAINGIKYNITSDQKGNIKEEKESTRAGVTQENTRNAGGFIVAQTLFRQGDKETRVNGELKNFKANTQAITRQVFIQSGEGKGEAAPKPAIKLEGAIGEYVIRERGLDTTFKMQNNKVVAMNIVNNETGQVVAQNNHGVMQRINGVEAKEGGIEKRFVVVSGPIFDSKTGASQVRTVSFHDQGETRTVEENNNKQNNGGNNSSESPFPANENLNHVDVGVRVLVHKEKDGKVLVQKKADEDGASMAGMMSLAGNTSQVVSTNRERVSVYVQNNEGVFIHVAKTFDQLSIVRTAKDGKDVTPQKLSSGGVQMPNKANSFLAVLLPQNISAQQKQKLADINIIAHSPFPIQGAIDAVGTIKIQDGKMAEADVKITMPGNKKVNWQESEKISQLEISDGITNIRETFIEAKPGQTYELDRAGNFLPRAGSSSHLDGIKVTGPDGSVVQLSLSKDGKKMEVIVTPSLSPVKVAGRDLALNLTGAVFQDGKIWRQLAKPESFREHDAYVKDTLISKANFDVHYVSVSPMGQTLLSADIKLDRPITLPNNSPEAAAAGGQGNQGGTKLMGSSTPGATSFGFQAQTINGQSVYTPTKGAESRIAAIIAVKTDPDTYSEVKGENGKTAFTAQLNLFAEGSSKISVGAGGFEHAKHKLDEGLEINVNDLGELNIASSDKPGLQITSLNDKSTFIFDANSSARFDQNLNIRSKGVDKGTITFQSAKELFIPQNLADQLKGLKADVKQVRIEEMKAGQQTKTIQEGKVEWKNDSGRDLSFNTKEILGADGTVTIKKGSEFNSSEASLKIIAVGGITFHGKKGQVEVTGPSTVNASMVPEGLEVKVVKPFQRVMNQNGEKVTAPEYQFSAKQGGDAAFVGKVNADGSGHAISKDAVFTTNSLDPTTWHNSMKREKGTIQVFGPSAGEQTKVTLAEGITKQTVQQYHFEYTASSKQPTVSKLQIDEIDGEKGKELKVSQMPGAVEGLGNKDFTGTLKFQTDAKLTLIDGHLRLSTTAKEGAQVLVELDQPRNLSHNNNPQSQAKENLTIQLTKGERNTQIRTDDKTIVGDNGNLVSEQRRTIKTELVKEENIIADAFIVANPSLVEKNGKVISEMSYSNKRDSNGFIRHSNRTEVINKGQTDQEVSITETLGDSKLYKETNGGKWRGNQIFLSETKITGIGKSAEKTSQIFIRNVDSLRVYDKIASVGKDIFQIAQPAGGTPRDSIFGEISKEAITQDHVVMYAPMIKYFKTLAKNNASVKLDGVQYHIKDASFIASAESLAKFKNEDKISLLTPDGSTVEGTISNKEQDRKSTKVDVLFDRKIDQFASSSDSAQGRVFQTGFRFVQEQKVYSQSNAFFLGQVKTDSGENVEFKKSGAGIEFTSPGQFQLLGNTVKAEPSADGQSQKISTVLSESNLGKTAIAFTNQDSIKGTVFHIPERTVTIETGSPESKIQISGKDAQGKYILGLQIDAPSDSDKRNYFVLTSEQSQSTNGSSFVIETGTQLRENSNGAVQILSGSLRVNEGSFLNVGKAFSREEKGNVGIYKPEGGAGGISKAEMVRYEIKDGQMLMKEGRVYVYSDKNVEEPTKAGFLAGTIFDDLDMSGGGDKGFRKFRVLNDDVSFDYAVILGGQRDPQREESASTRYDEYEVGQLNNRLQEKGKGWNPDRSDFVVKKEGDGDVKFLWEGTDKKSKMKLVEAEKSESVTIVLFSSNLFRLGTRTTSFEEKYWLTMDQKTWNLEGGNFTYFNPDPKWTFSLDENKKIQGSFFERSDIYVRGLSSFGRAVAIKSGETRASDYSSILTLKIFSGKVLDRPVQMNTYNLSKYMSGNPSSLISVAVWNPNALGVGKGRYMGSGTETDDKRIVYGGFATVKDLKPITGILVGAIALTTALVTGGGSLAVGISALSGFFSGTSAYQGFLAGSDGMGITMLVLGIVPGVISVIGKYFSSAAATAGGTALRTSTSFLGKSSLNSAFVVPLVKYGYKETAKTLLKVSSATGQVLGGGLQFLIRKVAATQVQKAWDAYKKEGELNSKVWKEAAVALLYIASSEIKVAMQLLGGMSRIPGFAKTADTIGKFSNLSTGTQLLVVAATGFAIGYSVQLISSLQNQSFKRLTSASGFTEFMVNEFIGSALWSGVKTAATFVAALSVLKVFGRFAPAPVAGAKTTSQGWGSAIKAEGALHGSNALAGGAALATYGALSGQSSGSIWTSAKQGAFFGLLIGGIGHAVATTWSKAFGNLKESALAGAAAITKFRLEAGVTVAVWETLIGKGLGLNHWLEKQGEKLGFWKSDPDKDKSASQLNSQAAQERANIDKELSSIESDPDKTPDQKQAESKEVLKGYSKIVALEKKAELKTQHETTGATGLFNAIGLGGKSAKIAGDFVDTTVQMSLMAPAFAFGRVGLSPAGQVGHWARGLQNIANKSFANGHKVTAVLAFTGSKGLQHFVAMPLTFQVFGWVEKGAVAISDEIGIVQVKRENGVRVLEDEKFVAAEGTNQAAIDLISTAGFLFAPTHAPQSRFMKEMSKISSRSDFSVVDLLPGVRNVRQTETRKIAVDLMGKDAAFMENYFGGKYKVSVEEAGIASHMLKNFYYGQDKGKVGSSFIPQETFDFSTGEKGFEGPKSDGLMIARKNGDIEATRLPEQQKAEKSNKPESAPKESEIPAENKTPTGEENTKQPEGKQAEVTDIFDFSPTVEAAKNEGTKNKKDEEAPTTPASLKSEENLQIVLSAQRGETQDVTPDQIKAARDAWGLKEGDVILSFSAADKSTAIAVHLTFMTDGQLTKFIDNTLQGKMPGDKADLEKAAQQAVGILAQRSSSFFGRTEAVINRITDFSGSTHLDAFTRLQLATGAIKGETIDGVRVLKDANVNQLTEDSRSSLLAVAGYEDVQLFDVVLGDQFSVIIAKAEKSYAVDVVTKNTSPRSPPVNKSEASSRNSKTADTATAVLEKPTPLVKTNADLVVTLIEKGVLKKDDLNTVLTFEENGKLGSVQILSDKGRSAVRFDVGKDASEPVVTQLVSRRTVWSLMNEIKAQDGKAHVFLEFVDQSNLLKGGVRNLLDRFSGNRDILVERNADGKISDVVTADGASYSKHLLKTEQLSPAELEVAVTKAESSEGVKKRVTDVFSQKQVDKSVLRRAVRFATGLAGKVGKDNVIFSVVKELRKLDGTVTAQEKGARVRELAKTAETREEKELFNDLISHVDQLACGTCMVGYVEPVMFADAIDRTIARAPRQFGDTVRERIGLERVTNVLNQGSVGLDQLSSMRKQLINDPKSVARLDQLIQMVQNSAAPVRGRVDRIEMRLDNAQARYQAALLKYSQSGFFGAIMAKAGLFLARRNLSILSTSLKVESYRNEISQMKAQLKSSKGEEKDRLEKLISSFEGKIRSVERAAFWGDRKSLDKADALSTQLEGAKLYVSNVEFRAMLKLDFQKDRDQLKNESPALSVRYEKILKLQEENNDSTKPQTDSAKNERFEKIHEETMELRKALGMTPEKLSEVKSLMYKKDTDPADFEKAVSSLFNGKKIENLNAAERFVIANVWMGEFFKFKSEIDEKTIDEKPGNALASGKRIALLTELIQGKVTGLEPGGGKSAVYIAAAAIFAMKKGGENFVQELMVFEGAEAGKYVTDLVKGSEGYGQLFRSFGLEAVDGRNLAGNNLEKAMKVYTPNASGGRKKVVVADLHSRGFLERQIRNDYTSRDLKELMSQYIEALFIDEADGMFNKMSFITSKEGLVASKKDINTVERIVNAVSDVMKLSKKDGSIDFDTPAARKKQFEWGKDKAGYRVFYEAITEAHKRDGMWFTKDGENIVMSDAFKEAVREKLGVGKDKISDGEVEQVLRALTGVGQLRDMKDGGRGRREVSFENIISKEPNAPKEKFHQVTPVSGGKPQFGMIDGSIAFVVAANLFKLRDKNYSQSGLKINKEAIKISESSSAANFVQIASRSIFIAGATGTPATLKFLKEMLGFEISDVYAGSFNQYSVTNVVTGLSSINDIFNQFQIKDATRGRHLYPDGKGAGFKEMALGHLEAKNAVSKYEAIADMIERSFAEGESKGEVTGVGIISTFEADLIGGLKAYIKRIDTEFFDILEAKSQSISGIKPFFDLLSVEAGKVSNPKLADLVKMLHIVHDEVSAKDADGVLITTSVTGDNRGRILLGTQIMERGINLKDGPKSRSNLMVLGYETVTASSLLQALKRTLRNPEDLKSRVVIVSDRSILEARLADARGNDVMLTQKYGRAKGVFGEDKLGDKNLSKLLYEDVKSLSTHELVVLVSMYEDYAELGQKVRFYSREQATAKLLLEPVGQYAMIEQARGRSAGLKSLEKIKSDNLNSTDKTNGNSGLAAKDPRKQAADDFREAAQNAFSALSRIAGDRSISRDIREDALARMVDITSSLFGVKDAAANFDRKTGLYSGARFDSLSFADVSKSMSDRPASQVRDTMLLLSNYLLPTSQRQKTADGVKDAPQRVSVSADASSKTGLAEFVKTADGKTDDGQIDAAKFLGDIAEGKAKFSDSDSNDSRYATVAEQQAYSAYQVTKGMSDDDQKNLLTGLVGLGALDANALKAVGDKKKVALQLMVAWNSLGLSPEEFNARALVDGANNLSSLVRTSLEQRNPAQGAFNTNGNFFTNDLISLKELQGMLVQLTMASDSADAASLKAQDGTILITQRKEILADATLRINGIDTTTPDGRRKASLTPLTQYALTIYNAAQKGKAIEAAQSPLNQLSGGSVIVQGFYMAKLIAGALYNMAFNPARKVKALNKLSLRALSPTFMTTTDQGRAINYQSAMAVFSLVGNVTGKTREAVRGLMDKLTLIDDASNLDPNEQKIPFVDNAINSGTVEDLVNSATSSNDVTQQVKTYLKRGLQQQTEFTKRVPATLKKVLGISTAIVPLLAVQLLTGLGSVAGLALPYILVPLIAFFAVAKFLSFNSVPQEKPKDEGKKSLREKALGGMMSSLTAGNTAGQSTGKLLMGLALPITIAAVFFGAWAVVAAVAVGVAGLAANFTALYVKNGEVRKPILGKLLSIGFLGVFLNTNFEPTQISRGLGVINRLEGDTTRGDPQKKAALDKANAELQEIQNEFQKPDPSQPQNQQNSMGKLMQKLGEVQALTKEYDESARLTVGQMLTDINKNYPDLTNEEVTNLIKTIVLIQTGKTENVDTLSKVIDVILSVSPVTGETADLIEKLTDELTPKIEAIELERNKLKGSLSEEDKAEILTKIDKLEGALFDYLMDEFKTEMSDVKVLTDLEAKLSAVENLPLNQQISGLVDILIAPRMGNVKAAVQKALVDSKLPEAQVNALSNLASDFPWFAGFIKDIKIEDVGSMDLTTMLSLASFDKQNKQNITPESVDRFLEQASYLTGEQKMDFRSHLAGTEMTADTWDTLYTRYEEYESTEKDWSANPTVNDFKPQPSSGPRNLVQALAGVKSDYGVLPVVLEGLFGKDHDLTKAASAIATARAQKGNTFVDSTDFPIDPIEMTRIAGQYKLTDQQYSRLYDYKKPNPRADYFNPSALFTVITSQTGAKKVLFNKADKSYSLLDENDQVIGKLDLLGKSIAEITLIKNGTEYGTLYFELGTGFSLKDYSLTAKPGFVLQATFEGENPNTWFSFQKIDIRELKTEKIRFVSDDKVTNPRFSDAFFPRKEGGRYEKKENRKPTFIIAPDLENKKTVVPSVAPDNQPPGNGAAPANKAPSVPVVPEPMADPEIPEAEPVESVVDETPLEEPQVVPVAPS